MFRVETRHMKAVLSVQISKAVNRHGVLRRSAGQGLEIIVARAVIVRRRFTRRIC
ncbi:hypothetical protein BOSEA31B_11521 [Hyphomicrobiales bacterium]|nr:hypothetical protein BOSEA31B_11521 [Hyphomicrobiales bacterium]